MSIFEGIAYSLTRAIYGLFLLLIGLLRYDKNVIPKWFRIGFIDDSIYSSFKSLITLHVHYNNPIFLYTINCMIPKENCKIKRIAKKCWIAYIMSKFSIIHIKSKEKKIN